MPCVRTRVADVGYYQVQLGVVALLVYRASRGSGSCRELCQVRGLVVSLETWGPCSQRVGTCRALVLVRNTVCLYVFMCVCVYLCCAL